MDSDDDDGVSSPLCLSPRAVGCTRRHATPHAHPAQDLDFDAFFDEDDMEEITSVSANLIVVSLPGIEPSDAEYCSTSLGASLKRQRLRVMRQACGLGDGSESVVHKGDVDEGKIMWIAPEFAGLDNSSAGGLNHWGNKKQTWSRDGATDEFFDEIDETAVPEELPEIERRVPQRNKPQMSESILQVGATASGRLSIRSGPFASFIPTRSTPPPPTPVGARRGGARCARDDPGRQARANRGDGVAREQAGRARQGRATHGNG